MFLIGLTGGIAAGKSTVAQHWQDLGGVEIDADQLARDVVGAGTPGLAAVAAAFGSGVVLHSGELDRAALADIVFADAVKRAQLEAITHPLVREAAAAKLAEQAENAMVIYNVPLLVEAGVDLPFDRVVTVEAPIDDQIERLVKNRGMTTEQAMARIRNQASPAQRANRADFILNSNQSLDLLLKDAGKLWLQFEREAQAKARAKAQSPEQQA
jgi:dephospho-CoA kinase